MGAEGRGDGKAGCHSRRQGDSEGSSPPGILDHAGQSPGRNNRQTHGWQVVSPMFMGYLQRQHCGFQAVTNQKPGNPEG